MPKIGSCLIIGHTDIRTNILSRTQNRDTGRIFQNTVYKIIYAQITLLDKRLLDIKENLCDSCDERGGIQMLGLYPPVIGVSITIWLYKNVRYSNTANKHHKKRHEIPSAIVSQLIGNFFPLRMKQCVILFITLFLMLILRIERSLNSCST